MKNVMLSLFAGFGAFVAIAFLSIFDASFQDVVLLMAPFGATTVLVFGVPQSPLAQPKNVIIGHLITAFIGVLFVQFFTVTPVSMALATGLAVSAMLITKTTHPPAGANPLLIMLSGQSWMFLLTPVLTGAIAIVLIGRLMMNIQRKWAD
ncbi:HPP family protein [Pseudoalteromonas xiamenensis]|uniref:HPP family protein n=1 Tax=Pseudoalteromonas xiamenensis TaxID=882626 RepID=A0A975DLB7_9GAMM|nr:HPP family protein [Pseudoalteromonas xiamenensis]QTH73205.1 HPP family protein [Pseudoalteromonas xiamenensis]